MANITTDFGYVVGSKLSSFPKLREDLKTAHPGVTDLVCGAFILNNNANRRGHITTECKHDKSKNEDPAHNRVLLLQRASTDHFPDRWDFPGGLFEDQDADIFDAVAREVFEETGLHVSRIIDFVGFSSWTKPNVPTRRWGKFCFVVEVEESEGVVDVVESLLIKCAPDEHQGHFWAAEKDLDGLSFMTQDTLKMVQMALAKF